MPDGWIGLTDRWQEGKWQTPDKKDTAYTNWAADEPNDAGGNEDCVEQKSSKHWNDVPCHLKRKFACQVLPGKRLFFANIAALPKKSSVFTGLVKKLFYPVLIFATITVL